MAFTVEKKQFEKAIASVMPAISTRSTLPILSGVRLTGADTRYAMEATDLELRISLQSAASGTGKVESAVVPAKALAKAIKSIPADELTVSFEETEGRTKIEIRAEKRTMAIEAFPSKDFPEIAEGVEWQAVCWFEGKEFADALSKVVLCASTDDSRPVLTGIQFNFGENLIELVATDSYRVGVLTVETERMGEVPGYTPIVPARVLKSLAKQLRKHDGRGIVYLGTAREDKPALRLIQFSFGTTCWTTRQIEGEYPNWSQLLPAETGASFEFDAGEMATAVKGAAELRSQKSVPVKLCLGDRCVIRMEEAQVAKVAEPLGKAAYSPDGAGPMEVAYNPTFLLDGIAFVDEDKIVMRTTDPYKPALFHSPANPGAKYVLMPVRLSR